MLKRILEIIIIVPLAIIGMLLFMIIDIIRMANGMATVDEEWQANYMDANINHGQGPLKEDK